jgi:cell division protein FtsQ
MVAAFDNVRLEASPAGRPGKGRPGKGRPGKGRPVKARSRKPVQGATRKSGVVIAAPVRRASAWLNRLLILTGAAVVIAAAVQAYITLQSIPVQRISVTGELEYTQTAAVQEMVQPALAGGFLKADLQRIREQLEGLPWIYEAQVRRKWPNALEIHVVEQLPIARWGQDGFLNHEGEVFNSGKQVDEQFLPLLQGPAGAARSLMANYLRVLEMLAPLGLTVEQLSVDERGQVEAVLGGGTILVLGKDDFLDRMHRFVAIYREELAGRAADVESVDLRYESGLAVAFREPSQTAEL